MNENNYENIATAINGTFHFFPDEKSLKDAELLENKLHEWRLRVKRLNTVM